MMPRLSVIIPVYNRPTLVAQALDSVVNQTLSHDEYEIIVVDDCSTDNTMDVLNDYQSRYPELIRIIQLEQNSGGASRPRNVGIDSACGEYVYFHDSDDTIIPETLQTGLDLAYKDDCDVVFVYLRYTNKESPWSFPQPLERARDIFQFRLRHSVGMNHIYKLGQIRKLGLRVYEGVHGHEDNVFRIAFVCRTQDLKWNMLCDNKYYRITSHSAANTYRKSDSGSITQKNNNLIGLALISDVLIPALIAHPPLESSAFNLAVQYTFAHLRAGHNRDWKQFSGDTDVVAKISATLNTQLHIKYDTLLPPDVYGIVKALRDNDPVALLKLALYRENIKTAENCLNQLQASEEA
jgi:glycosyltransferase involved in cell wall biosynthesis